tara:strand:+ start:288 stop:515 length:228 start_codon:yes stop_codon:yes gene_type:complete
LYKLICELNKVRNIFVHEQAVGSFSQLRSFRAEGEVDYQYEDWTLDMYETKFKEVNMGMLILLKAHHMSERLEYE